MRCKECNVDLGEEYLKCPLCGTAAVSEEPLLEGVVSAPYPKYDEALLSEKSKFHSDFPQKYALRAGLAVCLVLAIVSLFTTEKLWSIGVPAVLGVNAVLYFIFGCAEKGKLLHSAVSLLKAMAASVLFIIISAVASVGLAEMSLAGAACAGSFLLLAAVKPKKTKLQLKAFFNL